MIRERDMLLDHRFCKARSRSENPYVDALNLLQRACSEKRKLADDDAQLKLLDAALGTSAGGIAQACATPAERLA